MTTANSAFKVHIENMPDALNTKKDVDEYCKQFWKEYKEKAKEKKAVKAEKPKRKKGVDKDGNPKEKRAPSAYNVFVKEKYAEIKEANPEMDKTEIFAEIAKLWQGQKAENAKAPSNEEKKVSDKKSPEKKNNEEEEMVEVVEAPKKKPGRKAIVKKAKKTSPEEAQEEASE